jgi:hypothetical protein
LIKLIIKLMTLLYLVAGAATIHFIRLTYGTALRKATGWEDSETPEY